MEEKYYDPVWKKMENRHPSAVDDCADITSGYEQQLELQLNKTIDATPEEVEEWYQKELKWWGDRQLNIVAIDNSCSNMCIRIHVLSYVIKFISLLI